MEPPMKYMMLIVGNEDDEAARPREELDALYGRILAWWNEQSEAGRIVEGHELQPSATATTVRIGRDGTSAVTDGPYVEAKEYLGSIDIIEADSYERAVEIAGHVPFARYGSVEIRPLFGEATGNA